MEALLISSEEIYPYDSYAAAIDKPVKCEGSNIVNIVSPLSIDIKKIFAERKSSNHTILSIADASFHDGGARVKGEITSINGVELPSSDDDNDNDNDKSSRSIFLTASEIIALLTNSGIKTITINSKRIDKLFNEENIFITQKRIATIRYVKVPDGNLRICVGPINDNDNVGLVITEVGNNDVHSTSLDICRKDDDHVNYNDNNNNDNNNSCSSSSSSNDNDNVLCFRLCTDTNQFTHTRTQTHNHTYTDTDTNVNVLSFVYTRTQTRARARVDHL